MNLLSLRFWPVWKSLSQAVGVRCSETHLLTARIGKRGLAASYYWWTPEA